METQNNFAIGSIPKHIMSIAGTNDCRSTH